MYKRMNWFTMCFVIVSIVTAVLFLLLTPRIPQWLDYHQFADRRILLGIPNFSDVISNALFLFVGVNGLVILAQTHRKNYFISESLVYTLLFISIILVFFGSVYYHLAPDNARLVWDRIPMSLVFMTTLSLTVMHRIHYKLGLWLLGPLLFFGVFSVVFWYCSELRGLGDLRFYGLVQFYSMTVIAVILMFFPKPYPPTKAYLWLGAWYCLAKLAEYYDRVVFTQSGAISGHTLKHLIAGIACYGFIMMVKARNLIPKANGSANLEHR